jgi:dynein heavy chain
MTDTQIISESFIEDINNLLNTGEIPNLWKPEDKDKIINGVRPVVIRDEES